jgi:hypothetical protein
MKKVKFILILFVFSLFNFSESKAFKEGTTFWYKHASHEELVSHYKKMELDEMCAMWKRVGYWKQKRRVPNRNAMKEALRSQGEDPFICMKIQNP